MYNYNNVLKSIDYVKALNTTASKKADHQYLWYEVKKAFDFCYDMTACMLFDYEFSSEAYNYFKAVNDNFKGISKKELDKMLKRSIDYLKNELIAIHRGIEAGDLPSDRRQ